MKLFSTLVLVLARVPALRLEPVLGTGTGRGTGAGTGIGIGARAGLDEIEAGDEPLPLIAITEKEYVFPGIRLEIFAALI